MTITVLFFAHYRDFVPSGQKIMTVAEGATVAEVAALLASEDVRLHDLLMRTRSAVGAAFVPATTVLHEGDELAFLPPMSGG